MSKANRRRKNKGGRPRLDVEREPNGRPVRSLRRAETEKETRAVVIEARARHFGGSESDCAKEEYGSVLGRLYLAKRITKNQKDAGDRFAEDYYRYCCLTGVPHPSAKAQNLLRVKGVSGDSPGDLARSSSNRIMKIEQTLGSVDVSGRPITSVTKRVCVLEDETGIHLPHMLEYLIIGLSALVPLYGLDAQSERAA